MPWVGSCRCSPRELLVADGTRKKKRAILLDELLGEGALGDRTPHRRSDGLGGYPSGLDDKDSIGGGVSFLDIPTNLQDLSHPFGIDPLYLALAELRRDP